MNTADAIKKWRPVIEGLEPSALEMAAHVMEAESLHLRELTEEARTKLIGPHLKYIFPILRGAVPRITVLDRLTYVDRSEGFVDFVHELILNGISEIFSSDYYHHHPQGETAESLRESINLRQLAERTAKTIMDLTAEEIPAI